MLYIDDIDCLAYTDNQSVKYVKDSRDIIYVTYDNSSNYPYIIVGGYLHGSYKVSNNQLEGSDGRVIELVDRPLYSKFGTIHYVATVNIPVKGIYELKKNLFIVNTLNKPIRTLMYNGKSFCTEQMEMIYSSGRLY
jgi:hypothetical protein